MLPPQALPGRVPKSLAWAVVAAISLPFAGAGVAVVIGDGDDPTGDPGALTEELRVWRATDGPRPDLLDITDDGGFNAWNDTSDSQTSGGVAIADIDADGRTDVVVGGGSGGVFFAERDGRWDFVEVFDSTFEVTSVASGDIDDDGHVDIVYGSEGPHDTIVWGGEWARLRAPDRSDRDQLESGRPTTGLLISDLDRDGRRDIARLGYGPRDQPAADVVWMQSSPRSFQAVDLPDSTRRSLAAEVADVDGDGQAEIWVTRDVGWASGKDSVYSLDESGSWSDQAAALGADLAIDGMGVTIADLTGDGRLDTYLSDLGDNEVLEALPDGGYRPRADTGLARIRPPRGDAATISSSWASGVVDLNLDGRLDVVVANGGFGDFESNIPNKIEGTTIVVDDAPAVLLSRDDGTFADVWPDLGLDWKGASRGMSAGDLDADGDTDLVFVIRGQGLRVYRNDTTGPTLRVLPGPGCDPAATTVIVNSDRGASTALLAPHTFLGAHARELITGASGVATVTVRYPTATVERTIDLTRGRTEIVVPCR